MKKIALAIMAIVLGFSSMAQVADSTFSDQKEFRNRKNHSRQNFEKLNLTDDQKAQIKKQNESFRQRMQNLNKSSNLSADQQKEKREALMKEHKEKINSILTPGQRKQAQEMRHDFAEKNKGEMRGRGFEERTKDLNLTPVQSTKMKDLNNTFRNNIQSIRENTSLSQEEKKEQMKSLMKKHKADMEALLNNEQKEQLKNHRNNRRSEAVK